MKIEYKCKDCGNPFFAQKNTNKKYCRNCKGKRNSQKEYKKKQKTIADKINNKFKSIQVSNINGRYTINNKKHYKIVHNALKKISDYTKYEEFIIECISKLEKDLQIVKKLKLQNESSKN